MFSYLKLYIITTPGDRAFENAVPTVSKFENAAPKVWNRLPLEIRQCLQSLNIYKVLLKTHLFKSAFY